MFVAYTAEQEDLRRRLRASDVHAALAELEGMGWQGDLDAMRESRVADR